MQNFRLFLLCATALTLIPLTGCVTSPGGSGVSGGSLDDTARYLAGLPGGARNDLAVSRTSPEWKSHQSRMDALWSTHAVVAVTSGVFAVNSADSGLPAYCSTPSVVPITSTPAPSSQAHRTMSS
jgi:hypothetical protein